MESVNIQSHISKLDLLVVFCLYWCALKLKCEYVVLFRAILPPPDHCAVLFNLYHIKILSFRLCRDFRSLSLSIFLSLHISVYDDCLQHIRFVHINIVKIHCVCDIIIIINSVWVYVCVRVCLCYGRGHGLWSAKNLNYRLPSLCAFCLPMSDTE